MKKTLSFLILFLFTMISVAQVNSVGKNQNEVIWDLLGTDTISSSFCVQQWTRNDTLILSIYNKKPENAINNPYYYFVDGICVRQRIVVVKDYQWPSGLVTKVVDRIYSFEIAQNTPNIQPSSDYTENYKTTNKRTTIK